MRSTRAFCVVLLAAAVSLPVCAQISISTDAGASWETFTIEGRAVFGQYASGSAIYAATSGGLCVSQDSGATWTTFTESSGLASSQVIDVAVLGSVIYAATDKGLSVSVDNGKSWATDIGDTAVVRLSGAGAVMYAVTGEFEGDGGYSAGKKVHVSKDGGKTWTVLTTDNAGTIHSLFALPTAVYLGADNGLSVSTDGGQTWKSLPGLANLELNGIYASGSMLCVATNGGTFASADGGRTWRPPLDSGDFVNDVCGSKGALYVADYHGGVKVSRDGGATWTTIRSDENVTGVAASGDDVYVAHHFLALGGGD